MTTLEFCIWLQGYFDISGGKALNEGQLAVVCKALEGVLTREFESRNLQPELRGMRGKV